MQLTGIRGEDWQLKLDGYPEGAFVRGLATPEATELCRLMLFRTDLLKVADWLRIASGADIEPSHQEALCSAALVRFCCCFEGTSGLRQRPLKKKNMFKADERQAFDKLLVIRNRAVAHNDYLYPGEFPLVVLDTDGAAIEAVVVKLDAPFSAMQDVENLRRLTQVALEWVINEFEVTAKEIVDSINSIPVEVRRLLRDATPEFKIVFGGPEDRFVKK